MDESREIDPAGEEVESYQLKLALRRNDPCGTDGERQKLGLNYDA